MQTASGRARSPAYLNYTMGKLMITSSRWWTRAGAAGGVEQFHDQFSPTAARRSIGSRSDVGHAGNLF